MHNELRGSEVVFYENNTWNHVTKSINIYTYTIEYDIKSGFATQELAEKSYVQSESAFQSDMSRIKKLTNMQFTFLEYLDYWMQNIYLPFCNSSAKAGYAWTIYQIIYPRVKRDILLGMITGKFLNELLEQCIDYCECAAPMVYKVLHLALQDAMDDGYIRNNPLPEMKRYEWKAPQITILTKEQLKVFLSAAKEYHSIYLEVLLALFCGLRKGEILGLKISDFDESAQTVDIDRQITRDYDIVIRDNHTYKIQSQKMSVKPPKSLSSYRTLKISFFIFKELACRIAENKEILAACNEKQWSEYICLGVKGNIKCESTFGEALKRICTRNGLPRITMHGLRHMFATILIEQNVPLEKISKLMGHKSTSTTFVVYCGVMEAQQKISQVIGESMDPAIGAAKVYRRGKLG